MTDAVDTNDAIVWIDPRLPPDPTHARVNSVRPSADNSVEGLERAHAAIVSDRFEGSRQTLEQAPSLMVVSRRGSGYDNVDVIAATEFGICVTTTPDAPTLSVSEYTVGAILALTRNFLAAHRSMALGEWRPEDFRGRELAGATVVVVGAGRIGRRVAVLLSTFGTAVKFVDPYADREQIEALRIGARVVELRDALPEADVLTVHAPYVPSTHHLIGRAELGDVKRGAVIVNVARGPVVDERAVLEGLDSGHLAGAALDVWDPEPPSPTSPLRGRLDVLATPHLAARTYEGSTRSREAAMENVMMTLSGRKPAGLVNPEVWERRRQRL